MAKRFIVSVQSSNAEQHHNFIEYLKEQRVGYWHHLSNTWLITDTRDILNSKILRTRAMEIFDNAHNLVIELNELGDTWSGFGPSAEGASMFDWLKRNWKKKFK